jgi:hypothetical protein
MSQAHSFPNKRVEFGFRKAHVGWIVRSDLFLEPAVSYQVVQQSAGAERLPVSEQTLRHRLRERPGQHRSRTPGADCAPHYGGHPETGASSTSH